MGFCRTLWVFVGFCAILRVFFLGGLGPLDFFSFLYIFVGFCGILWDFAQTAQNVLEDVWL